MSTERLKVLFITHSFPRTGHGPRSAALRLLADALSQQGVVVRVVAPDMRGDKRDGALEESVDRFRVAMPRTRGSATAASAAGKAEEAAQPGASARATRRSTMNFLGAGFGKAVMARRDFEPDVVHAHWWFPSGLVGSWISSLSSLPLVTSLHGTDPQSARAGSPARPLFRHVLRRSAAVTVESGAEARRLSTVLNGVTPVVAPLPFSIDLFQPAEQKLNRAALVVDEEVDPVRVADVIRMLVKRNMDVAVLRSGKDPTALDAAIMGADAGARVSLVDSKRADMLAGTLRDARVCVVMGDGESQRDVLSAAMLCAAPLALLGAEAGARDSSEHARVSLNLEGGSAQERLQSLDRLLGDESAVNGQAEAARMYALATLSPESCAARMLGVYLRALGDAAA